MAGNSANQGIGGAVYKREQGKAFYRLKLSS